MAMNAISVVNLCRNFGDFKAVSDVSFDVPAGGIFGFLGANGAGKSTTIKMLCGLLEATSGTINVAGVDVVANPEAVKPRIGYMSQKFSLYPDLTVEENLDFFGGAYGLKGKQLGLRIEEVLELTALVDIRTRMTGALPAGWKQRVALANALVHKPGLLFLDEPTAGVDPISRKQFLDIVGRYVAEGGTVFLTTHFMDEAEYCQLVGLMVRGKLVALGSVAQLKAEWAPGNRFLIQTPSAAGAGAESAAALLKILSAAPGVESVVRWADGFKITTSLSGPEIQALVTAGAITAGMSADMAPSRIQPVEATLDDVFTVLTLGRQR
jgi:ABC-2 type transport system ATP-binding protein